ncbi:MAG: L-threonylcarbamoyladenylate synthase [Cyanobacteria bacterium P01_F01_bin.86]
MSQVSLQDFVHQVRAGEALASFPTDTVPALATRPDQSSRIYAAKQRPPTKPLILMGATLADLLPYVVGSEGDLLQWQQITERYWPGALTLVLPASDRVPMAMNPMQTGTLGIRVPNHPLARYLLSQTGPLATTSVNRSGQPPLEDMEEIAVQFPEALLLAAEAITTIRADIGDFTLQASGIPSTVICWQNNSWTVLRQGAVDITKIESRS